MVYRVLLRLKHRKFKLRKIRDSVEYLATLISIVNIKSNSGFLDWTIPYSK
jgi:hypothetical protein